MADVLEAFALHQRARGLSEQTVKRELLICRVFERDTGVTLLDATAIDIQQWVDHMPVAPRTRSTYISYLSSFYRWAVRQGHTDHDPVTRVERPRLRRLLPRPIPDDDLRVGLAAIAGADTRMRLWILLGAFEGLRVSEVAALRWEDIRLDATPPALLVERGKGGHQRFVPLAADTEAALRAYGVQRSGYLFPSRCGCHPLRPQTVTKYVGRHFRSVGVESTMHPLRHWFGSTVYQRTRDLRLVQELLGHSSVTTTQIYTRLDVSSGADVVRGLSLPDHDQTPIKTVGEG